MLTAYTNPTNYDVRRDLVPKYHHTYCIVSLQVLWTYWWWRTYKPKHVVVSYISFLSDTLLCLLTVCIFRYIHTICFVLLETTFESVNTIIFGTKVNLIGQVPGVQQHILGHHSGSEPSAGAWSITRHDPRVGCSIKKLCRALWLAVSR